MRLAGLGSALRPHHRRTALQPPRSTTGLPPPVTGGPAVRYRATARVSGTGHRLEGPAEHTLSPHLHLHLHLHHLGIARTT